MSMQVLVENIEALKRRLTVEIPREEVNNKKQEKLKEFSKKARIDGFRKGRVPISLIEQKYGKSIKQEVTSEIIDSSFKSALEQEKLLPVGETLLEEVVDKENSAFKYVISFEMYPEINLTSFDTIELEKSVPNITEKDVDTSIAELQDQFAKWEEVQREARAGDKVTIDFEATIDDKPFKGGSSKNVQVEIGKQKFLADLEQGLIGVKLNDNKDLYVNFPKDYHGKEIAGKVAKFAVIVNSISEKHIAPIDGEFAKRLGIEDGDTTKIREQIRINLDENLSKVIRDNLREQVREKLLQSNKVDIPNTFLEKEKKSIIKNLKEEDPNKEINDEEVTKEASETISISLIMRKIMEQYNISLDQVRVEEKLKNSEAIFGGREFVDRLYREYKGFKDNIDNTVLTEQILDFVIDHAIIKEKESTFQDIVNRSA